MIEAGVEATGFFIVLAAGAAAPRVWAWAVNATINIATASTTPLMNSLDTRPIRDSLYASEAVRRLNVVETGGILTHARRAAQLIPAPLRPESDNRVRIGLAAAARCIAVLALDRHDGVRTDVVDTRPPSPVVLAAVTWNTHGGRGDLSRLVADLERGALIPTAGCVPAPAAGDRGRRTRRRRPPRRLVHVFRPGPRGRRAACEATRSCRAVALRNPRMVPLPRERQTRAAATARIDVAGHRAVRRVSASRKSRELVERRAAQRLGAASPGRRRCFARSRRMGRAFSAAISIRGSGPASRRGRRSTRRFTDTPDWPQPPTFGDRLVLDHLLMDLPDGWRVTRRVLSDDYGSDHHPVIAVVSGPPEGGHYAEYRT